MSRKLTKQELEILASRPKVRRIAVENFLSSCPIGDKSSYFAARMNLSMDAGLYKWNRETIGAISEGLSIMFGGPTFI